MRIADMDPRVTEFRQGRSRTVGNWSFEDYVSSGVPVRDVYHYRTLMVRFAGESAFTGNGWNVGRVTIGHGTVSDQQGINQLCRSYGLNMYRNNGFPRVEDRDGNVVAD